MKQLILYLLLLLLFVEISYAQTPTVPTLRFPNNRENRLDTVFTLVWSQNAGDSVYHLQLCRISTFDSLFIVDDSTLTTSFKNVDALSRSKTYWWKVRAINGSGASAYSSVRRFTIKSTKHP